VEILYCLADSVPGIVMQAAAEVILAADRRSRNSKIAQNQDAESGIFKTLFHSMNHNKTCNIYEQRVSSF
jgi:hypothetical protein